MAQTGPFTGELEDLYRGRYRHFLRVATAIVGDETSGHDAVQDGFAQALREQESFRSEGPLEAWVWRTVVNAALAARRRQVARREASRSCRDREREWRRGRIGCSRVGVCAAGTARLSRNSRFTDVEVKPC